MKKIKFLGTAILAASLLLAGCSSPVDDVVNDDDTPVTLSPEDDGNTNGGGTTTGGTTTGGTTTGGGSTSGGSNEPVINYTAPDLTDYYKRYLVSTTAENTIDSMATWDSGAAATKNADGTFTLTPTARMWGGVPGACAAVTGFTAGELVNYDYLVFTLDLTDYVIQYGETAELGVNVKVPENLQDVSTNCTVNGTKRTYYAPMSLFTAETPSAFQFGLIIGGAGTLKLEELYLAAETDPNSLPVTSISVSVDDTTIEAADSYRITVIDSNNIDRSADATFTIAENDSTNSSITGNVFTAGSTAGEAVVTVTLEGHTETITFNVITEKYYGKYFKNDSVMAEAVLDTPGYMALWYQNWDPVVNITSATASETEYSIVRESVGAQSWSTQFFYKENAGSYNISFNVTSSAAGEITINNEVISLEADTPYAFSSTKELSALDTLLSIQLGKGDGNSILPAGTFTISDFSVTPASAAE